jgi:hypothetical protein
MSARANHSFLTWLLPLLILRAFVPAGFMLMGSGDGLQMVVCSGTAPATLSAKSSSDQHAHADHSHHQHAAAQAAASSQHDHQNAQAHEGSYCPFAIAGSASAPTIAYAFQPQPPLVQTHAFIALPEPRSTSILIDRIRGPPHA